MSKSFKKEDVFKRRINKQKISCPPLNLINKSESSYLIQAARSIFLQGDNQTSVKLFTAAIENFPGNWELHYDLGNSLMEIGKFEEARVSMEKAVELSPEELNPRLRLIEILIETGKDNRALELLNMLNETQAQNLQVRLLKMEEQLKNSEYEVIISEARQIIESGILLEEPFCYLAQAAIRSKRTSEVKNLIEEGIFLYPSNTFLNEAAAHTASENNEFVKALKYFETALTARPENMALLFAYAYCLYETGDIELAFKITEELKNSPQSNSYINRFHQQLKTLLKPDKY